MEGVSSVKALYWGSLQDSGLLGNMTSRIYYLVEREKILDNEPSLA